MSVPEPILTPTDRISAIPLDPKYRKIWANYKKQKKTIWFVEKIHLDVDVENFPHLPKPIQHSLELVLGFFAGSDEIVARNIKLYFLTEITIPEISCAYACQEFVENIHSEMYNTLIIRLVGFQRRGEILNAIKTFQSVRRKAEWANSWSNNTQPYSLRCIAFACVEGIFFSSSFAFIDWMKTQDYRMPALYESNLYISNDEARHQELACLIYEHVCDRQTYLTVRKLIDDAISVEMVFVQEVLPQGYRGMNVELMGEHVRHCAAILAGMLSYHDLYPRTQCPFQWMLKRSLDNKSNFFEEEGVEYNQPDVGDNEVTDQFSADADLD